MDTSKYLPSASVVTLCITVINLVITTISLVVLPYITNVSGVASLMAAYRIYLHISNVINIFGIIGVLRRQNSTMIAYAAWLFIDAVLSVIPRLAILWIVSSISVTLCTDAPVPTSLLHEHRLDVNNDPTVDARIEWNTSSCERTVSMTELATEVTFVGLMVLQLFAANLVRRFSKELSLRGLSVDADGDVEAVAEEKAFLVITEETDGGNYDHDNEEEKGGGFFSKVLR